MDVTVSADTETLEVEVVDRGVFAPFQALRRGYEAESGRGIALMLALMDNVEFERSETGTRARLRKHLRQRPHLRLAG